MAYRLLSFLRLSNFTSRLPKTTRPTSFSNFFIPTRKSSNESGGIVKPPIRIHGLEGSYATALYSAAFKNKALEQVENEMKLIQEKLQTDDKLKDFLYNPTHKKGTRIESIKELSESWKLSTWTTNFLILIAENGRLGILEQIIKAFLQMMASHRYEVTCEVTSAQPLTDQQLQRLQAVLKQFTHERDVINLKVKVDPKLIGGVIVVIGDKYVDMSVATKMRIYTDLIAQAI